MYLCICSFSIGTKHFYLQIPHNIITLVSLLDLLPSLPFMLVFSQMCIESRSPKVAAACIRPSTPTLSCFLSQMSNVCVYLSSLFFFF